MTTPKAVPAVIKISEVGKKKSLTIQTLQCMQVLEPIRRVERIPSS